MNTSLHRAAEPAYRTILVPLYDSRFTHGALPAARALAARFGAGVHTVTAAASEIGVPRIRRDAAAALGTDAEDPRIHVEVDLDVAGAIHRCASQLDSCLICLSTHAPGRVGGAIGSTARDIIERGRAPVVVAGPRVVNPPLQVDRLVVCVDGTPESERGMPVAAAWAHALGMKLTIVTVAEPCPPPVRIGAPWQRGHGPNEDADEYIRRLGEQWALEAPGLETDVIYDPVSAADGMEGYLAAHPAGLIVVGSHLRDALPHLVFGSGAAAIVHVSPAPALVVPVQAVKG